MVCSVDTTTQQTDQNAKNRDGKWSLIDLDSLVLIPAITRAGISLFFYVFEGNSATLSLQYFYVSL